MTPENSEITTEQLRQFEQFLDENFVPCTVEYRGGGRWIGLVATEDADLTDYPEIHEGLRGAEGLRAFRVKRTHYRDYDNWIHWYSWEECKEKVREANS
jgi:hypothetical protein